MTLGLAHKWRSALVEWSGAKAGDRVLDCACGTGDLALAFAKTVEKKNDDGVRGSVVGTDFCKEMLERAPQKAKSLGLQNVAFEWADAMNLSFADDQYDVTSMAYGIRNVADPVTVLKEMARVTKPGGRVMILETGDHASPLVNFFLRSHFRFFVPLVGGWITGKRAAYEYLNRSSSVFPSRENFLNLMNQSGAFSVTEYRSILGGASYIYKGVVGAKRSSKKNAENSGRDLKPDFR